MGLLMGIFICLSIVSLPYIQSRKAPCATEAPVTYEDSTSDEIPVSTSIETVTEAPIRHMRPQHKPNLPQRPEHGPLYYGNKLIHPGKNNTPDRSTNREPSSEIREVPLHGITKDQTSKPLTPIWDNSDQFVNPHSYQKLSPSEEVTEPEDPTKSRPNVSQPNARKESQDPSSEHEEPPPPPGLTRKQKPSKNFRKKPGNSLNGPYIQAIPYSPEGVHNYLNPFLLKPEYDGRPIIQPDIIQIAFVEPSAIGTFDRSPVPPGIAGLPNYFIENPAQRPKKPVTLKIQREKPAVVPDRRPIRPKITAAHHHQPVRQYRLKPDVKTLPIAPYVPKLATETPSTTTESPLVTNHSDPQEGRDVEHQQQKPTEEPFEFGKLKPQLPPWGSNMQENEPKFKQNIPPEWDSKFPENPKRILNGYLGMPPLAGEMVPTAGGQYFPKMDPGNLMPQNPENYLFRVFRIPSVPSEGYKPENIRIDPGLIPTMMAGIPQGSKPEIFYATLPRAGKSPYDYGPLFWPFEEDAPGSQKTPLELSQGYPDFKWEPYLTELEPSKPFQNHPFQSKPNTDLSGNAIPSTYLNNILNNFQEPIGNLNSPKNPQGPLLKPPKGSIDRNRYSPLLRQTPNFALRPWSKKPKNHRTSNRIPGKYPTHVDDRTGEPSQPDQMSGKAIPTSHRTPGDYPIDFDSRTGERRPQDQMLPFISPELNLPRDIVPYRNRKKMPQWPTLEQLRNLPPGMARAFGLPEDQATDHPENRHGSLFQSPNSSMDRLGYPSLPNFNFGPTFEPRPSSNIPKKHMKSHRIPPNYLKDIGDRIGEGSRPDHMLPFVNPERPRDIVPNRQKIPHWPSLQQLRNLPPGMARAFGLPEDQATDHMELKPPNGSMDRFRYPYMNPMTSNRIPLKYPKNNDGRTGEGSQLMPNEMLPFANSKLNPSRDIVPYGYGNKMPQWPNFEQLQNSPPGSPRSFGMPVDQATDYMENGVPARKNSDMYDPHGNNPMMDPSALQFLPRTADGSPKPGFPMIPADLLNDKKFVINVDKFVNMVAPVLRCYS